MMKILLIYAIPLRSDPETGIAYRRLFNIFQGLGQFRTQQCCVHTGFMVFLGGAIAFSPLGEKGAIAYLLTTFYLMFNIRT
jgi:hypothetical protein